MKIWKFTFADGKSPTVSVDVAAKDKFEACALLTSASDLVICTGDLFSANNKKSTLLCHYAGEIQTDQPKILSYIKRETQQ